MNWNIFFIIVFITAGMLMAYLAFPEAPFVVCVVVGIATAYALAILTNMVLDIVDEVRGMIKSRR